MASTSAKPPAPPGLGLTQAEHEAREARIAERTDALCLKQMLRMGRQSYILMPSVFFIAAVAVSQGAAVWAAVWFVAWVARMVYVYRLVGRLRNAPDAPSGPALASVVRGYVFAGIVAGGLLPVFFTRSGDIVLLIVTFLVTIYGSTMMMASSGVLRAGLGYGIPTLGLLILGWLWHGGLLGFGLAAFLAMVFTLSLIAIRSQRDVLTEVVRVIDDNETLSTELARERDRAHSASESKTRFFAAASHDLRQPLHALSINATTLDLMARRSGDALMKDVSHGIASALRQSQGLIDALLDISRLDANAVQTRMKPHDLSELLHAVRGEFAALAAQRGLSLHVQLQGFDEGGSSAWAVTDDDQLLRILVNLVDNAIKFTREGGVLLSAQPASEGRVLVRVSDTGPGIAESESERVFEEFYQVGNPSRDRSRGLGLGLAIVKRTATLLGISLRVVPAASGQRGAVFELLLPAAAAPDTPVPLVASEPSASTVPAASAAPQEGLSVLLVDDEPQVLASLCLYLQQIGWTAVGVATGDEAEAAIAKGLHPDVLAVDFRLRGETGADVIQRLRSAQPGLPVVIVTGDTAAPRLREFAQLGFSVVHKPVDGQHLAERLSAAAGKPHSGATAALAS